MIWLKEDGYDNDHQHDHGDDDDDCDDGGGDDDDANDDKVCEQLEVAKE